MSKGTLERWGLSLTLLYVLLLGVIVSTNWDRFCELSPNEWGDFLAGSFGPLALAWIVLGFFLQSRELQASVDTLKLQTEELRHSVEQQKAMVEVTRESLQHEREVLGLQEQRHQDSLAPRFVPIFQSTAKSGQEKFHFSFRLLNSGAVATNIEFHIDFPDHPEIKQSIDGLQRAESTENRTIIRDIKGFPTETVKLKIFYTNQVGRQMSTIFELTPPKNSETDWSKQFHAEQISESPVD
ncbi:MAG: hypothetical protein AB3N09_11930 [Tateyamaria sp.]